MVVNPFKVGIDTLQYLLGFMVPIAFNQPFAGIAPALAIVASVYAVTKRHNIRRNSTGAIRVTQRYPMIHSYRMPQPRRTTTDSAMSVEIIKRALPVRTTEPIREISFTCFYSLKTSLFSAGIVKVISLSSFSLFLPMRPIIFSMLCAIYITLGIVMLFLRCLPAVRVFLAEFIGRFFYAFRMLGSILTLPLSRASYALRTKSVGASFIFYEFNRWLCLTAFRAAFNWGVHSISLLLYLMLGSADGEIIRRFGLQSLADVYIIPQIEAL